MKKSVLCCITLLLTAWSASAQQAFFLTGGLGVDYQKQSYTLGLSHQEYTDLMEKAWVDFSSAFWSWDLLRYTFSLSGSRSNLDLAGERDTNRGVGYSARFHLFPLSRDQVDVSAGRNAYDFESGSATNYSQRSDYLHARGILQGWALTFDRADNRTEGDFPDQRLDENADLKKVWNVGMGTISLDAQRNRTDQEFFGTDMLQESAVMHTDQHFSADHSFWMDAIYRSYDFKDTPLGLENSISYGTTTSQWRYKTGPLWETQVLASTYFSGGQNAEDTQWLNRFFLSAPLSVDVTTGYYRGVQDGEAARYPYDGLGLDYSDTKGDWTTQMQGGYLEYHGNAAEGTPDNRAPYGLASLTLSRAADTFTLSVQYNGAKEQILAPTPSEGSPFLQTETTLTTDNFLARLDAMIRLGYQGSLRLQSYENTYKQKGAGVDDDIRSLTNELDLLLIHGTLGARMTDEDQTSPVNPWRFHSKDIHAAYGLTPHLTLRGYYIWRDKRIYGRTETDTEGNAMLDYMIGKFSLRAVYQVLSSDEVQRTRHSVFTVSLVRRFGND